MHPYPRQYLITDNVDDVAKKNHAVIIIGGDAMALAVAHYLSKNHDGNDILIVSPTALGAGIKNRQWAMVRANYQTGPNTPFFEMNLRLWEDMNNDLGYNVMLSQPGMIELLLNDKMIKHARHRGNTMRLHGIDADYIELAELRRMLPLIDFSETASQSVLAGLRQGRAGFFNPMAAFYGFWRTLSPRRVKIIEQVAIKNITFGKNGNQANGLKVTKNGQTYHLQGQKIVLAMADGGAGLLAHSPDIKKTFAQDMTNVFGKATWPWVAGAEVELLSESISPLMSNIIQFPIRLDGVAGQPPVMTHASLGQGELGNLWLRAFSHHPLAIDAAASDNFFAHLDRVDNADNMAVNIGQLARTAVQLIPALLRVKLLTKWRQTFLSSFDGAPIIDGWLNKSGLYTITGINGDGYAITPAASLAMAHLVATGEPHPFASDYNFQRFAKGRFFYERAV